MLSSDSQYLLVIENPKQNKINQGQTCTQDAVKCFFNTFLNSAKEQTRSDRKLSANKEPRLQVHKAEPK